MNCTICGANKQQVFICLKYIKGVIMMNSNIKNTLDDIPQSEPGAKKFTALALRTRAIRNTSNQFLTEKKAITLVICLLLLSKKINEKNIGVLTCYFREKW